MAFVLILDHHIQMTRTALHSDCTPEQVDRITWRDQLVSGPLVIGGVSECGGQSVGQRLLPRIFDPSRHIEHKGEWNCIMESVRAPYSTLKITNLNIEIPKYTFNSQSVPSLYKEDFYKFLNVCPFDYTVFAVSGKVERS